MSSTSAPRICALDLSVQFPGRTRRALSDVTVCIEPGNTVAIAGPSGCGKTTLLRTLAEFIPDLIHADVQGGIRLDGQWLGGAELSQLSQTIGLVQQDPDAQVCTLRVGSEVAFGPENLCLPRQEIDVRVRDALEHLAISHLVERDTTTLSGGEKQRLAVASILTMKPSVILLDEPTAHLDPAGAKALFELLQQLQRQTSCTLLIVEHRLSPLEVLNPQLWIMDAGRLVKRKESRIHADVSSLAREMVIDEPMRGPLRSGTRGLRIEGLCFGYTDQLLSDLSLTVHPGEILGIIGPNGGGKTTLLRLMAGLEKPDAGVIARPVQLNVGMVFQHPHQQIFERTVRRDLELESPMNDLDVASLLASARLSGLSDVPPHSLSLGEQRRLTVLTALGGDPDLLLLDEPFIGQDRDNASWIVEQIWRARDRGTAVCLVTHDIPMADVLCDRLLYLGEDVLIGSPHEVFGRLRDMGNMAFTPQFWLEGE